MDSHDGTLRRTRDVDWEPANEGDHEAAEAVEVPPGAEASELLDRGRPSSV